MANEQIEQFEPVADTYTHVLIDSWYHCRRVRRAVQKLGWAVSGALKSNRWMRLAYPSGEREWIKLSACHPTERNGLANGHLACRRGWTTDLCPSGAYLDSQARPDHPADHLPRFS